MQAAASAPNLFFAPRGPGGRFGGGPSGRLHFDCGQGRYRRAAADTASPKRYGHGRGQGHGQNHAPSHGQVHAFDASHAVSYLALNGHYYQQGSGPSSNPIYDHSHNYNHYNHNHNHNYEQGPDVDHGAGAGLVPRLGIEPRPGHGPRPGCGPGPVPGAPSGGGRATARRGRGSGRGRRGGRGGRQDAYNSAPSSGPGSSLSSSHGSSHGSSHCSSPRSPRSSRSRNSSQSSRSTPSPLSPPPSAPTAPSAASPTGSVNGSLGQHSRSGGDGRRRGRFGGAQPRAVAPCQLKQLPPPPPPPLPPPPPPTPPPPPHLHSRPPPPVQSSLSDPRAGTHGPPPGNGPAQGPFRYSYFSTVVHYEEAYNHQRAHSGEKKMISNDQLSEDCMVDIGKGSFYYSTNNIAQMMKHWPHSWHPPLRKSWKLEKYPPRLFQNSEWDDVSRDIWDKYVRNKQKQASYERKVNICKMISAVVAPVHPGYMFLVTGSTLNGFGTERSDLDICLLVDDSNATSRDEALAHLERIQHTLNDDSSMTRHVELILAKVPILKFRDARWDIEVDINCNSNVAIRNTHLLYCYSICDWRVRPLVTIVKLWAARHRINDAKIMTISSYSLVLMVIHFLQCGVSPPVLPCLGQLYPDMFSWQRHVLEIDVRQPPPEYFQSMNNMPLGNLLLEFLQYYLHFDFSRFALSVRLGTKIPIEECRLAPELNNGVKQKPFLCIEEPFERTNTAYAVHSPEIFGRILAVFRNSYTELKKTKLLSSIFKRVP